MKTNAKLSLVFNLLIVAMEVISLTMPMSYGAERLQFYTIISNYLALIPCLMMVIFIITRKEINKIPFWVILAKYVITVALALTFIVVIVVLIPLDYGFAYYLKGLNETVFSGVFLYHHLLCPVLAVISFIFFEGDRRLNKKKTMYYPCLYTLVYAFVIVVLNITGKVAGPYSFLQIMINPWYVTLIWIVVIGIINYLIARYILLFNQIKAPRIKLKR